MRRLFGVLLVLGLLAPAPVLSYPLPDNERGGQDRQRPSENEAEAIEAQQDIYDYGACLVQARRGQVERYLAAPPFSSSVNKIARQLVMSACLDAGDFDFDPEAIRGPFYQALYQADFRDPPGVDLREAPELDYSRAGAGGTDADVLVNLRRFADCVVRHDPANTRRLSFSRVGSAQEASAFRELKPAMGSCIKAGDTIAFQPPLLRAVLNEVQYRLTVAAVGRPMAMDRN